MSLAGMVAAALATRVGALAQRSALLVRGAHLLARQPALPASEGLLLRTAWTPQVVPACGLKRKGILKRRCKDCYFVYRDKVKYVMCSAHPRHKAVAFSPKEKFTWVLSPGPMQSKQRPW